MKNYIKIALLSGFAFCFCACSDFLEEYSQDMAKVETWEDLDELLLGDGYLKPTKCVSAYSSESSDLPTNLDILHLMGDEMAENKDVTNWNSYDLTGYKTQYFGFYTWQQDTGTDEDLKYVGGDDKFWNMLYSKINTTNMVLALIDEQPEENDDDRIGKERVKGEAHFLRAAYYFILANLYAQPYVPATAKETAGVPIKTSEYVEDKEYLRQSLWETYNDYILADLDEAETYLNGKTRASVYHANLTATYLLKSRVYLYMQNWEKAAEYAQKTLDEQSTLLDLNGLEAGTEILTKGSRETIFSMGGYQSAVAFMENESNATAWLVSDDMVQLYSENDLRKNLYIGYGSQGSYPIFTKVNPNALIGKYAEVSDCFLMRTSEAYLILAEASAYANNELSARNALRTFLATRMAVQPDLDAMSGHELIDFIRDERAREFLLEGHRWFDLRRYTVCEPYPWSKEISHSHIYYADFSIDYIDTYTLEKFDAAYTLPIPRSIREFQISIGNNDRPNRTATREQYESDDSWWW